MGFDRMMRLFSGPGIDGEAGPFRAFAYSSSFEP